MQSVEKFTLIYFGLSFIVLMVIVAKGLLSGKCRKCGNRLGEHRNRTTCYKCDLE